MKFVSGTLVSIIMIVVITNHLASMFSGSRSVLMIPISCTAAPMSGVRTECW